MFYFNRGGTVLKQKIILLCIVLFVCCLCVIPCIAADPVGDNNIRNPDTGNSYAIKAPENFNPYIVKPEIITQKETMTQSEQKLSTALLLVTKSSSDSSARNQQVSGSGLITKTLPASVTSATRNVVPEKVPSGNLVYVYISTQPGYSTHIADSLVADVTDRDEENHLAVGWVDIQNLLTIAGLEGVRNIREVIPPVVRMGSVTTQGDAIHKTANVRSICLLYTSPSPRD